MYLNAAQYNHPKYGTVYLAPNSQAFALLEESKKDSKKKGEKLAALAALVDSSMRKYAKEFGITEP